ncbi:hypothetical protein PR202_ga10523 [Eleusine coracana subsp. coracana]|uniref:Transmembrane protein n=1 Tax=Eleusine coracana subsp. coracana TaxID=191504 RepID=A0AAV5C6W3_ELECO|nr:hypothetical protein PR202_ga10523 [Eleusine coracana subsp. coracana]
MNWQDQVMLTHTKFSSCLGVSFKPKPSQGSSFSLHAAARPPPDGLSATGQWVWLPAAFSRGSSRIFPASQALGRSLSRASSHFCDLEDEDTDYESAVDEESAVSVTAAPVDDNKKPREPASAGRSRLGVILLDQGLFTVYKRLFVLCIVLNATGLALAATGHFPYARGHAAVFAMGNILALTLCRSEAVLRVVFWLAVALFGRPWVPVLVKTGVTAILQSLGGVHSGCGVSSLAWLVYALVQVLQNRDETPGEIVGVVSAILGLLTLSCMAAFPLVRHLHHNMFERTHRFAGWAALALLWAFVVLSVGYDPATDSYDKLTDIADALDEILAVEMTGTDVATTSASIPAMDTTMALAFIAASALLPHNPDIVDALDEILAVEMTGTDTATTSASTPSMDTMRGADLNCCIRSAPSQPRVVMHDTAVMGRPNVAELAVDAAQQWGAEVVVGTSNSEGSRDIVTGCRKVGILAFGSIWDS